VVNAFILINIEGKDVREITNNLLAVDGVTEVYPIAGEYDIIAVVRVIDNPTMANVIIEEIIHKPGVRHTKTLFALDSYAKVDLEKVYAL
jgi:DNA-binding Lrp family transcriptional regulator